MLISIFRNAFVRRILLKFIADFTKEIFIIKCTICVYVAQFGTVNIDKIITQVFRNGHAISQRFQ